MTIGPFIADFACVETRLIVEADGGQHGSESDARRAQYLETLGWKVLRFWNHDILQQMNAVLEVILLACEERAKRAPSTD